MYTYFFLHFWTILGLGSDLVQGGSYISHAAPVHRSVQSVRGFLTNHGQGGSIGYSTPSFYNSATPSDPHVARARHHPTFSCCQEPFGSSFLGTSKPRLAFFAWLTPSLHQTARRICQALCKKQPKRVFTKLCFDTYLITIATDQ